ncbi:MAG: hypothetical protein GC168_17700 [Candidatus Hydrogenedens sp.]|nr:hypothetical protein [Candidatus Hydrogenedens sp.]
MERQLEFHWTAETEPSGVPVTSIAALAPVVPPLAEREYAAMLADSARVPVRLAFTNNRSTIMSVRHVDGMARVRLHRMFLDAPHEVREAVARWVRNPKSAPAGRILDAFIRAHRNELPAPPPRAIQPREDGQVHNLRALYDEVNQREFGGGVACSITWGLAPRQRRRRSIRLGSYCPATNLIRIHPRLDDTRVPAFFVRYVIFHEMLHAHLGIHDGPDGRRRIHHAEFQRYERAYPDYQAALDWLEDPRNLGRLLRSGK